MRKSSRVLIFIMLAALCLAGCTLAPKYTRPAAPVPSELPDAGSSAVSAAGPAAAELQWREFFADEKLRKLIELALENNRDLKIATLNVERARALYGIQRDELLPSVYGAASRTREHTPADLSPTGREATSNVYSATLGVSSWELDLFGRVQSLKNQALERYFATDEARRAAQISLISGVAQAYLTLAADQENLKLAKSTFEAQQTSFDLIGKRYQVGIATELDLSRAQTQVDNARRDAAHYTQMVASDENALNLLLGSAAPKELLPTDLSGTRPPKSLPAELRSEVLLSRPDVMQDEHGLKGAYANIGAARAALFPSISLTTSIGTASSELNGLFDAGSRVFRVMPQVTVPIFDMRVWHAYKVSKIDREIALATYEKAVQSAFRDTADALAALGTVDEQLAAQKSMVEAVSKTYKLSSARYSKGIDNYLNVLDAQRSLYGAQQGLVALKLQKDLSQVRLYAVLGGGVK